jgi:hypothetical protein
MISHIAWKAVFGGKLASNGSGQVATLLAKHTKRDLVRFALRRLDVVMPTGGEPDRMIINNIALRYIMD